MFVPGSTDTSALDRAMRLSLCDSLQHILHVAGDRLGPSVPEAQRGVDAIRAHRVVPGVFGLYYKLVLALRAGSWEAAADMFSRLLDQAGAVPAFRARLYDEASLGGDRQLYGDLIDPNSGAVPWLCPPPSPDGFEQRVQDALDVVSAADPALAAELRGLLLEVVGAVPYHGPGARRFGSASSFMLPGLAVVNMELYGTAAMLTGGLVHEAAHLLLFAHSVEEPLVTNPIEDRFKSPLRADPRPMDGVFHATFVTARLHWLYRKLREATGAGVLSLPAAELDTGLAEMRALYFGGLHTVREHGQLTPTGQRIIGETLDYMQDA